MVLLSFCDLKLRNLYSVKDSVPLENSVHVSSTNLLVLAVMLATLAKPVVIFPHVSVNISLQTSPSTFVNT